MLNAVRIFKSSFTTKFLIKTLEFASLVCYVQSEFSNHPPPQKPTQRLLKEFMATQNIRLTLQVVVTTSTKLLRDHDQVRVPTHLNVRQLQNTRWCTMNLASSICFHQRLLVSSTLDEPRIVILSCQDVFSCTLTELRSIHSLWNIFLGES